eukprot:403365069
MNGLQQDTVYNQHKFQQSEEFYLLNSLNEQYLGKEEFRSNSSGKYQCHFDGCLKIFNSQSSLSRHKNVHLGIQPYTCPFPDCKSRFSQRTSLRHHVRTHTGEKPYTCDYCGWAFATKGNKIDHERRHLKIKPYKCTQCLKPFYRPHQLKQHQSKCGSLSNEFLLNQEFQDQNQLHQQSLVFENTRRDLSNFNGLSKMDYSQLSQNLNNNIDLELEQENAPIAQYFKPFMLKTTMDLQNSHVSYASFDCQIRFEGLGSEQNLYNQLEDLRAQFLNTKLNSQTNIQIY